MRLLRVFSREMEDMKRERVLITAGCLLVAGCVGSTAVAVYLRHRLVMAEELQATAQQDLARLAANRSAPHPSEPAELRTTDPVVSAPVAGDAVGDEETTLLRERAVLLEAALHEKDQMLLASQRAQTNDRPSRADRPPDRRRWLDDLKNNDPQAYEEFLARREESRRRMNESLARKSAFFLNRDTSTLSEEEQAAYGNMLTLLDETWRAAEQLQADLPREERRELRRTLFRNVRELSPMLEAERDVELYNLGRTAGYTEEEAGAFADYVSELIDLTSLDGIFRNMGPRAGFWGDGPPRSAPETGAPAR